MMWNFDFKSTIRGDILGSNSHDKLVYMHINMHITRILAQYLNLATT